MIQMMIMRDKTTKFAIQGSKNEYYRGEKRDGKQNPAWCWALFLS
ncbi:hypothetical protein PPBDW_I20913 [Photobacterium kishitanii]|nr:hypothetical protein PPBDW_I20913 [Photobacterium kishitanii]